MDHLLCRCCVAIVESICCTVRAYYMHPHVKRDGSTQVITIQHPAALLALCHTAQTAHAAIESLLPNCPPALIWVNVHSTAIIHKHYHTHLERRAQLTLQLGLVVTILGIRVKQNGQRSGTISTHNL